MDTLVYLVGVLDRIEGKGALVIGLWLVIREILHFVLDLVAMCNATPDQKIELAKARYASRRRKAK